MFARVLRRAAPHAAGAAAAVTAAAAAAAAASGGGAVGDQCGEQTREGGWRLPVPRAAVLRAEAAPTRAPFPLSSNFIADVADQVRAAAPRERVCSRTPKARARRLRKCAHTKLACTTLTASAASTP